jgi:hypothetical protein
MSPCTMPIICVSLLILHELSVILGIYAVGVSVGVFVGAGVLVGSGVAVGTSVGMEVGTEVEVGAGVELGSLVAVGVLVYSDPSSVAVGVGVMVAALLETTICT